MAILVLMRHAEADQPFRGDDLERPLSPTGQEQATTVNAWLAERNLLPDVVLVSPAVRCRSTAAIVAPAATEVVAAPLYLAEPEMLRRHITELSLLGHAPETLLVVAHNPGLHALVDELSAGEFTPDWNRSRGWPPATLAVVQVAALTSLDEATVSRIHAV